MSSAKPVAAPSLALAVMELRAFGETALMPMAFACIRSLPKGEGAPVLIIPGFMATDESTFLLRRWLKTLGYRPYGWKQGANLGLRDNFQQALADQLLEIHSKYRQTVRLIGWSLGGIQARALAHRHPTLVNSIITMGSPFRMPEMQGVHGPTARLYKRLNGEKFNALLDPNAAWSEPPPVPCTAIYSRGDGIANWDLCIDKIDQDQVENIGVISSHLGMGSNPLVLMLLANRLAEDKLSWRYFKASRLQKLIYQHQRAQA